VVVDPAPPTPDPPLPVVEVVAALTDVVVDGPLDVTPVVSDPASEVDVVATWPVVVVAAGCVVEVTPPEVTGVVATYTRGAGGVRTSR
jgi:hypothetical protein